MGHPASHAVLVIDPGTVGGFTGDLADVGAVSFSVTNTGGSLLDLNSGAPGPTAVVNVFTQDANPTFSGYDMGPFGLNSTGGLQVRPGCFLQITAHTNRDHQVFFGRITNVSAIHNDQQKPGLIGWQRGWVVTASNLAVDLGEHNYVGTLPFFTEYPEDRMGELLTGAGSWWPSVPCKFDFEGGSTRSRIDKVDWIATADMGTLAAELDRVATSCWCWYAHARDPWRFGYATVWRALVRIVARESIWNEPTFGTYGRTRARLIGDPWHPNAVWSQILLGMQSHVDNENYLQALTVTPYNGANETVNITGDDMWGSRTATFDKHIGNSTGHPDTQAHGSAPGTSTTGGGAGWQIATAWADNTSFERHSFDQVSWRLGTDQAHNGDLLDLDRLDPLWAVWDDKARPLRCKGVTITAAGADDWRVTAELEIIRPNADLGVPTAP
jgi:hypothetical protein